MNNYEILSIKFKIMSFDLALSSSDQNCWVLLKTVLPTGYWHTWHLDFTYDYLLTFSFFFFFFFSWFLLSKQGMM